MWTFLKVRLKRFENFPTEWVLKIDSEKKLDEYLTAVMPKRVKDSLEDMIAFKSGRMDHSANQITYNAQNINPDNVLQGMLTFIHDGETTQRRIIRDGNILYVKCQGSFSHNNLTETLYEVLETVEKEDLVFPDLQPRYLQWPNGKHWYVKFGEKDFVVYGKQKWDTRAEAEAAVARHIEKTTTASRC